MMHTDEKLQAHLDALSAAAMDLDFTKMAEACIAILWATAEVRADFEELPALIEEHKDALQRAGNDFDSVVFADHLITLISSLVQRHGGRDVQQEVTKIFADVPAAAKDLDSVKIASAFIDAVKALLNPKNVPRRLPVVLDGKTIQIGRHFSVCFRRTLRIPEDGKDYPLPPGFSRFPICKVEDYADKVPAHWLEEGGFFIPVHQREALYLEFGGADWRPTAAKIGIGKINAVTGEAWDETIRKHKQDYVIVPDQHWLDGINSDDGRVRQFVAMPLGEGYTVEEQVTDEPRFGGIQVVAFESKAGVFPDEDPKLFAERERKQREQEVRDLKALFAAVPKVTGDLGQRDLLRAQSLITEEADAEMGLAAGGKIRQEIVEDYYGAATWDEECRGKVYIRIVNSVMFKLISEQEAPASPISAKQYSDAGLPWFDYYDENAPAVLPSTILGDVKSIASLDRLKGKAPDNREAAHVSPEQIRRIHTPSKEEQIKLLQKSVLASFDGRRFELAKRLADRLLELCAADVLALRIRAECNLQFRKWIHAEQDARDCLTLDPDSAFTLRTRAKANLMLGHYALRLQPEDAFTKGILEKLPEAWRPKK